MELVGRRRDDGARWRPSGRPAGDGGHHRARRPAGLLLPRLAVDVHLDPPGLCARRTGWSRSGAGPDPDRLRLAVRAVDDRRARLRSVRRDRLLGPDQPPGLARLRAPAAWDAVAQLGRRPVFQPGAERPRVRPDVRRPLCGRWRRLAPDRPFALRRPAAQGRPAGIGDGQGDVPAILLPRSRQAEARTGARAKARG